MSSRLVFEFEDIEIKPQIVRRIRQEFKEEFGKITTIPIDVQLQRRDGSWTTTEAYFDTGAGISLFSQQVGEEIGLEKFVLHELTGIAVKKACLVPVKISKVKVRFLDVEGKFSPEFSIWAAFAEQPVPQVIGMKGIIEKFQFETDPANGRFYLAPLFKST